MPCHPIVNNNGKRPKLVGFFCTGGPTYKYKGYFFEVHGYCGPTPLDKRNGEVRSTIPRGFWRMWDEFKELSPVQKRKYEWGFFARHVKKGR